MRKYSAHPQKLLYRQTRITTRPLPGSSFRKFKADLLASKEADIRLKQSRPYSAKEMSTRYRFCTKLKKYLLQYYPNLTTGGSSVWNEINNADKINTFYNDFLSAKQAGRSFESWVSDYNWSAV